MKNNKLSEELQEYQKDQEEIRKIIGSIGGQRDNQYRIISILFIVIIAVILCAGIIFKKISPTTTILVAILLSIVKIIWMQLEAQKSMHFQFWILNSLETRINDIYSNQRKILKKIEQLEENDKTQL